MKKSFFLAALAIAALSSCSSDDQVAVDQTQESEDLVPVVLGLGTPSMTVTTRGTGTVGSTDEASNHWQSEKLRVLMTMIPDEEVFANFGFTNRERYSGSSLPLFDNSFYCKPVENSVGNATLVLQNGIDTRYYPQRGSSDFFAYYIDDALSEEPGQKDANDPSAPKINKVSATDQKPDSMYVKFQIDGSQDIMAGKANYDSNYTGFSAKSARAGVTPSIEMNHLLTRLEFTAVPGNEEATDVEVDSIYVWSKYKGNLTVAYNERVTRENLIWFEEDTDSLILKQLDSTPAAAGEKNNLKSLEPVALNYATQPEGARIGEALFVNPNETSYKLRVVLKYPQANLDKEPVDLMIRTQSGAPLLAGKSYKVTIVVYGVNKTEIKTTLTPWAEGETIPNLNDDLVN